MDTWINSILDYANHELALIDLDKVNAGHTILQLIKDLHAITGNHPAIMKTMIQSIANLIDKIPISPITENDFQLEEHQGIKIWRCKRYPYIYKYEDGKYYNDRAIVYKTSYDSPNKQYIYQGGLSSKQEIELPYVVNETIVILGNG